MGRNRTNRTKWDVSAGAGSPQVIRNLRRFWSRKGRWLLVGFPFVMHSTEAIPVVPAKVPRRHARQVEVCGSNGIGEWGLRL